MRSRANRRLIMAGSAGIEHRLPWFDAASIFNVFGARPFEGAYTTWQIPVASLRTSLEVRGWGRAYDANLELADLGGGVVLAADIEVSEETPADGWVTVAGPIRRMDAAAVLTTDLAWYGVQEIPGLLEDR